MITTCVLVTQIVLQYGIKPKFPETVWHCNDVGFVISHNPDFFGLEEGKHYPFEVVTNSNGGKTLILKGEK